LTFIFHTSPLLFLLYHLNCPFLYSSHNSILDIARAERENWSREWKKEKHPQKRIIDE
jgi:hypothetical protein